MNIVRKAIRPAILLGGLLAATSAFAQGDPVGEAGPVVTDQQVDMALGTLDGLSVPKSPLKPPEIQVGFNGPLPFPQQPPAAQSDFSDSTTPVNPRGSSGIK